MQHINTILFDNFTTLDAIGPTGVFSCLKDKYEINYFSLPGGIIKGSSNLEVVTKNLCEIKSYDILIIPGGLGTRELVSNQVFIDNLRIVAEKSKYVLCICTGSALLAKTELLDGKMATSNKLSWNWVIEQNKNVKWQKGKRWVVDGKYYSSSGITAGIDMALGYISDIHGKDAATQICKVLEYIWNNNPENDPFSN